MKCLSILSLFVAVTFSDATLAGDDSLEFPSSKITGSCFPESWNELLEKEIILLESPKTCSPIKVLRCYCLTLDSKNESTATHFVIGHCFYGCFDTEDAMEYYNVNISNTLESKVCYQFNRTGRLCSQCIDGYGPPVYSFSLRCVKCGHQSLWKTVPKYILIAFGPLTVFLGAIVVFTISVNSAPLRGWILVCQLLSYSVLMRVLVATQETHNNTHINPYIPILGSIYGVWNLDFFRLVYKPFCLHPSLTTLQVMSLDYIITAYPLVMIIVMYKMVDLYSRNFRPIVFVGRLFHHCFIRFRHRLNIRTSLIDAFGTFFSLSYVKFLSTTVDILIAAQVRNSENNAIQPWSYFDGAMELFRGKHIPYAVVGICIFVFCNIVPLILLLVYSFPRAQVILNIIPKCVQAVLYPFMDNILSCYKDGTNGTRNCRYFAVVYHVALLAFIGCMLWSKNVFIIGVNTSVCIITGMLVAVIQPYKSTIYNTVDIILILSVGLCFAGAMSSFISYVDAPNQKIEGAVMAIFPLTIPFFYIVGYLGYKCLGKTQHRAICCCTITKWMNMKFKQRCTLGMMNRMENSASDSEHTFLVH